MFFIDLRFIHCAVLIKATGKPVGSLIVQCPRQSQKVVAVDLADSIGADLFEIRPEVIYTSADLDWTNKKSRSSLEMSDPTSRPAIAKKRDNMDEYDTIFVEFPIWWYIAPTIVNAFLESYDLTGKTIIPFATSGGSGMGKTNEALKPSCTGATLLEGKVWKSTAKKEELSVWADSLACR